MPSIPQSLLQATNFRSPFLRTLLPTIGLAYTIQAAAAIPSIGLQTERFYDLSGSLTYLSCTALSLYLPALRARAATVAAGGTAASVPWPSLMASAMKGEGGNMGVLGWNWRQVVLSAAVGMWALRLGSFLFARITADNGQDSRFEGIRDSPPKFFGAFFAQATWVSLCLLPVISLNALPAVTFAALPTLSTRATDILGLALFVGGLGFEATADRQKAAWLSEKKAKKHDEDFLTRGLWSKSRHPNYFGEITLWSGLATVAAGVMTSPAGLAGMGMASWKYPILAKVVAGSMAAVSPAFVTFLLTKVSGIPMSEGKYDKRYGDREDYKKWKRETPVLVPKILG